MKDKLANSENKIKKILIFLVMLVAVVATVVLTLTSIGADDVRAVVEAKISKYVNYNISEDDKGTLVQYEIRTGVQEGENQEVKTVKESELLMGLCQIDGKYPYDVKVIGKSTKATNGKTSDIADNYSYDANTGNLVIRASNVNENGDKISSTPISKDLKDEYSVICYYDTYTEEQPQREVSFIISSKYALFEDDRVIEDEQSFSTEVSENISWLTSMDSTEDDIFNGKIKSNIINGTDYNTEFNEANQIVVSKKEAQERLEIKEDNKFVRIHEDDEQELENNGNLVIKSTKLVKSDLEKILGEDGFVEIFDDNKELITTINKDSEYAEDGTITIDYENGLENITIKTSKIISEGIINIYNQKEIKSTMRDIDNVNVKTVFNFSGINEEKIVEEVENDGEETQEAERIEEKVVFVAEQENVTEVKDSKTNVALDVNNTNWTNKQQNEIKFDIYLNSNDLKDNMFKSPSIKIDLPSEVEKVILGNASMVYGNGLQLVNYNLVQDNAGKYSILLDLSGEQVTYNNGSLGLVTDIQIPATIILKKDIENATATIDMTYTNNFTVDGSREEGTITKGLSLENYKQENIVNDSETVYTRSSMVSAPAVSDEQLNNITTEVSAVKGDTVLNAGSVVYEGEYIRYNLKVTNTSDSDIRNLKVVATIPEGTTYGELEADYYHYFSDYKYNFDENLRTKEINIGVIKAGETYTDFYEIKVNDLEDGESQKEINTEIKTFIEDVEANKYETSYLVKPADVQVFLGGFHDNAPDRWDYTLKVTSDETKLVDVRLLLPEEVDLEYRIQAGASDENSPEPVELTKNEDNLAFDTIYTNTEYWYSVRFNEDKLLEKVNNKSIELDAIATVTVDDIEYKSNINRYEYQSTRVSVSMTSDNEGEEVKYENEINYEIVISNDSMPNLIEDENEHSGNVCVDIVDYLPEELDLVSVTYEDWLYNEDGEFEKEEKVLEIEPVMEDEDGDRLPDIDLAVNIPSQESVTIKIKATAGFVTEKTKIENSVTVSGEGLNAQTSNIVTHYILPYNYHDITPINPDGPDNPDDPDRPDDGGDNPSGNTDKYRISGLAWIDDNEDGERQTKEKAASDIGVLLVDAENSRIVSQEVRTNENGLYTFENLEVGKYIVVFKYDTETYRLTEYRKSNVSSNFNSDAMKKEITLEGNTQIVGATDIISLNASTSNIDVGLIRNKVCDLKLDKYISKVSVSTVKGTKEYNYNDSKLAKVEIKAKEIEGATVLVEYKIVVTNEGELPAKVNKIIDYLPEGLTFSSELNKDWAKNSNGQLVNVSGTNKTIAPGESFEVKLVLTKTMSSNVTGKYTNYAEIGEISNALEISDKDSKPANRAESEDDYSKAEVIISISTGAVVYIGIVLIGLSIAIVVLVILSKHGIIKNAKVNRIIKLGAFLLIFTVISGYAVTKSIANDVTIDDLPTSSSVAIKSRWFNFLPNGPWFNNYGSTTFKNDVIGYALCIDAGKGAKSATYKYSHYEKSTRVVYKNESDTNGEKLTLSKDKTTPVSLVKSSTTTNNGTTTYKKIYGPFKISSNTKYDDVTYTLEVYNDDNILHSRNYNINYCDSDGNNKSSNINGFFANNKRDATFYISLANTSDYTVTAVKLKGTSKDYEKIKRKSYKANVVYEYASGYQRIRTIDKIDIGTTVTTEVVKTKANVKWVLENGSITVIKEEEDTYERIPGVGINIAKVETDSSGNTTYTNVGYKITDENGICEFENLKPGKYNIEETERPYGYSNDYTRWGNNAEEAHNARYPYYELADNGSVNITIQAGSEEDIHLFNLKNTGNLRINKKDFDTRYPLDGAEFKIYQSDRGGIHYLKLYTNSGFVREVRGKIYVTNIEFTNNANEATKLIAENGSVDVYNIREGYYTIEETSVGNDNTYELDPNYITWEGGNNKEHSKTCDVEVWTLHHQYTDEDTYDNYDDFWGEEITCYNEKKYIDISGYVWVDKARGKGELGYSNRNDLFRQDENDTNDIPLSGISVSLVNRNDEIVRNQYGEMCQTTTQSLGIYGQNGEYNGYIGENGKQGAEYIFRRLLKRDVANGLYNVRFEYDGLEYEPVRDSEDSELNQELLSLLGYKDVYEFRRAYNYDYQEASDVFNNTSKAIEDGNSRYDFNDKFSYVEKEGTYTSNYSDGFKIRYNKEGDKSLFDKSRFYRDNSNAEFIKAYSLDLWYFYNGANITNMNLGLHLREEPMYGLDKDLYSVKLKFKGDNYTHIYKYPDNTASIDTSVYKLDENGFNVGVKWERKAKPNSYYRAIYKADLEYESPFGDELEAYITYKVVLANKSSLIGRINEIVDYYDQRYGDSIEVGTGIQEDQTLNGSLSIWTDGDYDYNENYKKVRIITRGIELPAFSNREIYVQYKLSRQAIKAIIEENNEQNQKLKENIVEIRSYTTYDSDGYVYAAIDKASAPGNAIPEDTSTYEADTSFAPALRLELAVERALSGKVFLENADEDMLQNMNIRQGNGKLDDDEKGIKDIKVKLIDKGYGEIANVYNGTEWVDAEVYTNEKGEFTIKGFVPGRYEVVYEWGGKTYTLENNTTEKIIVQNYKSTIVDETVWRNKLNDLHWYKDEENRFSDAIDDYYAREEIDYQIKEEDYNLRKELDELYSQDEPNSSYWITKMESTSPEMELEIENLESAISNNGPYVYEVKNVDFGIIERPRQQLQITKELRTVGLELANGQKVVNWSKATKDSYKNSNVQYMGPSREYNSNGFFKIEADNEIIQGAKMTVEYNIIAKNISERDYSKEEFYYYGVTNQNDYTGWRYNSDSISMGVTKLIDYLDNKWSIDEEENYYWEKVTAEDIRDEVDPAIITSDGIKNKNILEVEENSAGYLGISESTGWFTKVSKLLSIDDNDIELNNEAESIFVSKSGGALLQSIPGNYIPGGTNHETDDDMAETVIVTPNTGANLEYLVPGLIAITALVLLGTGVIVIKKKILNSNSK